MVKTCESSSEIKKKVASRLAVGQWSFYAQRNFRVSLFDILERYHYDYDESVGFEKISRFPTKPYSEPLIVSVSADERLKDEQGAFFASHFRHVLNGGFYEIAMLGFKMLQESKFRLTTSQKSS